MPGFSPGGIFLSYRREDAAPYALLLKFQLTERFSDARVFMDVDSIDPGLDFAEVIQQAVGSCAVLVALIGRQWATLTDEEGQRRIDDPDDLVRFEVQAALERGVRAIPDWQVRLCSTRQGFEQGQAKLAVLQPIAAKRPSRGR